MANCLADILLIYLSFNTSLLLAFSRPFPFVGTGLFDLRLQPSRCLNVAPRGIILCSASFGQSESNVSYPLVTICIRCACISFPLIIFMRRSIIGHHLSGLSSAVIPCLGSQRKSTVITCHHYGTPVPMSEVPRRARYCSASIKSVDQSCQLQDVLIP